ncbi:MAG: GNAT family N-acetyltransferase, partial [Pseudomonadota bacterium]
ARQIYIADHRAAGKMTKDMRKDRKLLRTSVYAIVDSNDFAVKDFSRAAELYQMLYLDRYSWQNPQYTARYLAKAHEAGVLTLFGMRGPDGQLDGVGGVFRIGQSMTMPLLGLDTDKPKDIGLYRMLCAIAQDRAIADRLLYNRSAGAAGFKRNRGAVPAIEYTGVYVDHLGAGPRRATRALAGILRRVGVPLLQRFAL